MKTSKERVWYILNIYILLQPIVDILTSLNVRYFPTALTVGIVVRFAFVGVMGMYLLFFYKGKNSRLVKGFFLMVSFYGILNIGHAAYLNGIGTLVNNSKMFIKMFYFIYVLLAFYAVYQQYGYKVEDNLLAFVFCEYAVSILISAITNTSFGTYMYAEGYCGWFYAGNEIGAIISILSIIAIYQAFSSTKRGMWLVVAFLVAFCSTYIGTKVPFLAIVAATVMMLGFSMLRLVIHKEKKIADGFLDPVF